MRRQSRGFLGAGGTGVAACGVIAGGVAGGNGAGWGVGLTGVAASVGAIGWEGAAGAVRATSANKGVGAWATGCVGTPPFAYGTPGFRKLLFSTVFFYILICSHPNETVSEYNHITLMAMLARGEQSIVRQIDKQSYDIVCNFYNAVLNWKFKRLCAGINNNVAGSQQREKVGVVG